jgi:NAD(P)-dependent dehydrogenase (short-subunit alcohol dehydrogenase family)
MGPVELADPRLLDHALYLFSTRMSAVPRTTVNHRVVIVGASDAALSAAAELVLNDGSVQMPHITLLAPAGQANYAAAKAGLAGMTKALAREVASRGITINVVAPGFVVTPMTDALNDAQKTKLTGEIPLGRLGQPEDIAASVVYLASDEAAWVTGTTLHVNGGMAMI